MTPAKGANNSIALSMHAGPAGLTLADDHGTWKGGLDAVIAQVHGDGTTTTDEDTTLALTLTAAQHDAIERDGLTISKTITIRPDAARLVVVVRDVPSGALGSVAIPASSLR